ncbi:MAG: polyribonucleotide nucleotidyltransferase [Patescibacteria group bacterium]
MTEKISKKILLGGRELVLEMSGLALRANASILVHYGETVVLATVVSAGCRDDLDYFPLQVEYVEKLYAGGRIKGSRWVKREGRVSDDAVLVGRMIDRQIRPFFPESFRDDTQVVLTVLSVDGENDPEIVSAIAASAVVHISDVPWNGPIATVKVALSDDGYVINPTNSQAGNSDLDLILSFNKKGIVMIDGGANQVAEDKFFGAIDFAQPEADKLFDFLDQFAKEVGKTKMKFPLPEKEAVEKIKKLAGKKAKELVDILYQDDDNYFNAVTNYIEVLKVETGGINGNLIKETVNKVLKDEIEERLFNGQRPDGRKIDQVRDLTIETGVLPRTHGSALFQRGETQALTITTLGEPSLKQLIENMEGEETKRYMHHYSMPPFSVGETGRFGYPGRREIGHGALAEKALMPVIPSEEVFPYAIRLVSEALSSDGSTSMASTCGSTLSLMDAGVPISDPVAGIAIGLVTKGEKYVLLTDMMGVEDFNGEMDFKVTGTKKGITAVQVDIKNDGLPLPLVKEAIDRAKKARLEILDKMLAVIAEPRKNISQYAPKVATIKIPVETIGSLIGPGGKNIRRLMEETGCNIDVEDDGLITVSGDGQALLEKAISQIDGQTRKVEPGETFSGIVKRLESFGAFVEFLPGREGLVHVSRMGTGFIKDAQEVLKLGQEVEVKLDKIDNQGRYDLTLISPKIEGTARPDSFHSPKFDDFSSRKPNRRYQRRF